MKSFGEVVKSIKWHVKPCSGVSFCGSTFSVDVLGANEHIFMVTVGFLLVWWAEGCVLWRVLFRGRISCLVYSLGFL